MSVETWRDLQVVSDLFVRAEEVDKLGCLAEGDCKVPIVDSRLSADQRMTRCQPERSHFDQRGIYRRVWGLEG